MLVCVCLDQYEFDWIRICLDQRQCVLVWISMHCSTGTVCVVCLDQRVLLVGISVSISLSGLVLSLFFWITACLAALFQCVCLDQCQLVEHFSVRLSGSVHQNMYACKMYSSGYFDFSLMFILHVSHVLVCC